MYFASCISFTNVCTYIESKKVGYNWPHGALERPLRSYIHILYHGKILFSIFLRLQQVAKVSLNGVVIDTASSVREVYTLGRSGIFRLSNTFVTSGLRLN